MSNTEGQSELEALWAHHHGELRDPHQIVAQWESSSTVEPGLLDYHTRGDWWGTLERLGATLLVTREYEHLVLAFCAIGGKRRLSYLRLPHPSGLAVDHANRQVHIASTRNPNMIFDFAPHLADAGQRDPLRGTLLPVRSRYLPGRLYLHDLAMIGGKLFANGVGLNTVVELPPAGGFRKAWWPRCVDRDGQPRDDKNYLQLNSIAAGKSLATSFFSASAATPSARRPGHLNFPVDRRGVIFSGKSREVVGTGLTRPHSARFFGKELWVDNSGYGELGRIADGKFEPVFKLNGWTRGLCFHQQIAFVGTSRVIPRFRHYAPGVDVDSSECGVHAIDLERGVVLGSLLWPRGNQIFAIETVDAGVTTGFPFTLRPELNVERTRQLFFHGLRTGS